jgi:leader peptidase (prepilin peptidase) / N-methyltransferase
MLLNDLSLEQITLLSSCAMFVIGCLLGSFFHGVGLRVPISKSIVFPPSGCVHCGHRLNAIDLMPVVGWLIRKGKCHYCGEYISPIYLFGELAAGISFAAATYYITDIRELWMAYGLISILIILSVSDLKYRLLPNKIIFPAMFLYLVLRLWIHELPLWEYFAGFIVGGGFLFIVSYVSLLMGKPAMGGGDIKLMALLGLAMGVKLILLTLAFSSLIGCLIGLILLGMGKIKRQTFIPFGPFIAIGGIIALLFGNQWLSWYWSLFPVI